jgi:hypothetical protein
MQNAKYRTKGGAHSRKVTEIDSLVPNPLVAYRRTIITRAGYRSICFGEGHGFSRAARS